MKDLSKGTISIKGFSFEVTTSRPETYLGILPQPSDFVPQVVTTTRAIKLEEHKVDFENNLDLSPDEVQSTNKVVLEMFTSLINASVALTQAMQAGQVQQRYYNAEEESKRRQHEKDLMNLADELDAKKHSRIQANRAS